MNTSAIDLADKFEAPTGFSLCTHYPIFPNEENEKVPESKIIPLLSLEHFHDVFTVVLKAHQLSSTFSPLLLFVKFSRCHSMNLPYIAYRRHNMVHWESRDAGVNKPADYNKKQNCHECFYHFLCVSWFSLWFVYDGARGLFISVHKKK